ncbi:MAG: hypothetical protein ACKVT0_21930, partial [Planctomycetaceae bacterium]
MLRQLVLMAVVSSCLWMITGCGDSSPPKNDSAAPAATPGTSAAVPGAPAEEPTAGGPAKETADGPDMPADDTKTDGEGADTEVATTTPDDTATNVPVSDTPAETADAAMMSMIEGIQNKKPDAVWKFMPPSYRSDLNGLVRDFAGKMDPEVWTKSFEVLQHAVKALEAKKELILSMSELENAPLDAEQRAKGYDAVVNLLRTIVECELSDLEKMKEFDGEAFLAGTGSSVAEQMMA